MPAARGLATSIAGMARSYGLRLYRNVVYMASMIQNMQNRRDAIYRVLG